MVLQENLPTRYVRRVDRLRVVGPIYGGVMLHRLISIVLASVISCTPALAGETGLFLDGGIGLTNGLRTTPDGIWVQEPFPHSFDYTDIAFKAGFGLTLDEHWTLNANYVSLGTMKAVTEYISDEDYAQHNFSLPKKLLTTYDSLKGPQFLVSYRWNDYEIQPIVSGGMAYLHHKITANITTNFEGDMPTFVMGTGLCYGYFCGEVFYYRAINAPSYPISTQFIVPMVSMKVPLW